MVAKDLIIFLMLVIRLANSGPIFYHVEDEDSKAEISRNTRTVCTIDIADPNSASLLGGASDLETISK